MKSRAHWHDQQSSDPGYSAGVMYLQQRGLRGTLMIQLFSAGYWGQFYRNSSFFMWGRWPECPKLWFGLAWASPCRPIYLSPLFVLLSLNIYSISRLILRSAVTSECQSEPLVQALILAISVAAELLWTVADGWREVAQGWGWGGGVIFRKCWRHRNMQGRQHSAEPLLTKCKTYRKQ